MRKIHLIEAPHSSWESYYLYDVTYIKDEKWFYEESKSFFIKYWLERKWNKFWTKYAHNTQDYIITRSDNEVTFYFSNC